MSAFPLVRIFGIEVRAHWTWVPMLAIVSVIFGGGLSGTGDGALPTVLAWSSGIVIAASVFLSVAVHEIAHVVLARRNGLGANVVVIQLLGGAYLIDVRPRTAQEELRISLAGPIVSLTIAILIGLPAAFLWLGPINLNAAPLGLQAAEFVITTIAMFNVFVLAINLIPGYPLDGARILHAIAWLRSGDDDAATVTTSRIGRRAGGALMVLGALITIALDPWAGIGLMLAGWLVMGSSRLLDRRTMLRNLVAGVRVGDAADESPARVPPQLTLDVFAAEYLGERMGSAALVERGEELLGLIGTAQIRRIPRRNWGSFHTEQVMIPIARVPETTSDADLWPVLEILERSGLDGILVASDQGGHVLLTRRSAANLIAQRAKAAQVQLVATVKGPRGWFRGK